MSLLSHLDSPCFLVISGKGKDPVGTSLVVLDFLIRRCTGPCRPISCQPRSSFLCILSLPNYIFLQFIWVCMDYVYFVTGVLVMYVMHAGAMYAYRLVDE